jgi:hypothetical protein
MKRWIKWVCLAVALVGSAQANLSETDARVLAVLIAPVERCWPAQGGWQVVFRDGRRMTLWDVTGGAVGLLDGERIPFVRDARGWHMGGTTVTQAGADTWLAVSNGQSRLIYKDRAHDVH